jgi:hypothetical protein
MKSSDHSYQNPKKGDWVRGLLVIALYIFAISISAFYLLIEYWYLWLMIVSGGLILMVNWHTRSYAYRCRNCGSEFEISFLTNLVAPHGIDKDGGWSWLKCSQCNSRHKATVIKIVKTD